MKKLFTLMLLLFILDLGYGLEQEEWEGQLKTLKTTVKVLMQRQRNLIYEVFKIGYYVDVSTSDVNDFKIKKR